MLRIINCNIHRVYTSLLLSYLVHIRLHCSTVGTGGGSTVDGDGGSNDEGEGCRGAAMARTDERLSLVS